MDKHIGIIGGTFNPIHLAHLIIAETFFYQLNLDRCFFVPAFISPSKKDNSEVLASTEHRLQMIKLSIKDNEKFEIDTFEINNQEVSYTIKTIDFFSQKFSDGSLYLLIGDDQALYFDLWKDWEKIIKKTQLCIAKRKINLKESEIKKINKKLTLNNKPPIWLENPFFEISSEEIRDRIRNNKSIKYLVTEQVENYIRDHSLYKGT